MLEHISDEKWKLLTRAEKDALIEREAYAILWQLDMIAAGLCVPRAGLIWRVPLCHDSYGVGY